MQRADVLEAKTTVLNPGDELAFSFSQLLERGFYAPNPGWCVTGIEIHDAKGSTQSWLEMLTSQNGIQFRVFGGVMGSNGAPVDNADKYYGTVHPFPAGIYHDLIVGIDLNPDRTKGRLRVMLDDQQIEDKYCAFGYVNSTGYIKQAFYRDPKPSTPNVDNAVRYGNLSVLRGSTAYADAIAGITPPPPPPPPPVYTFDFSKAQAEMDYFKSSSPHIYNAILYTQQEIEAKL
jgi:hypothetical protein